MLGLFNYCICFLTLSYKVWSSIVIVHEKFFFFLFFFASFIRNISKTAERILIKIIGRNLGVSVHKKSLISDHRKKLLYIFEILIILSKCLLVSIYVTKFLWTLCFFFSSFIQNISKTAESILIKKKK